MAQALPGAPSLLPDAAGRKGGPLSNNCLAVLGRQWHRVTANEQLVVERRLAHVGNLFLARKALEGRLGHFPFTAGETEARATGQGRSVDHKVLKC